MSVLPLRFQDSVMPVEVQVLCAPHPLDAIEDALWAVERKLATQADSVSVEVCQGERLTAILELEMRRAAASRVVDEIYGIVRDWAWAFHEDVTIRFSKD